MKQPVTAINGHQFDYDCDSITTCTCRSAILVLPQTQKITGWKNFWIQKKIGNTTKLSGFKSFQIQTSHLKFQIENLWRHD